MRSLVILIVAVSLLLAGCASQGGAQQTTSSGQVAQPSGKGFTITDSSNLTTTNGSQTGTSASGGAPESTPQNNTVPAPVASGSGGQIVDVGGSIPVDSGPSGSGN
jgi:ABC-type Fe3+-hydroxamate transport system substrate-binding protein